MNALFAAAAVLAILVSLAILFLQLRILRGARDEIGRAFEPEPSGVDLDVYINPDAPAGGDGSFERPFRYWNDVPHPPDGVNVRYNFAPGCVDADPGEPDELVDPLEIVDYEQNPNDQDSNR